jgi:hypothetical protein
MTDESVTSPMKSPTPGGIEQARVEGDEEALETSSTKMPGSVDSGKVPSGRPA